MEIRITVKILYFVGFVFIKDRQAVVSRIPIWNQIPKGIAFACDTNNYMAYESMFFFVHIFSKYVIQQYAYNAGNQTPH